MERVWVSNVRERRRNTKVKKDPVKPWFVRQCGILACKEAISLICYTYTHRHDTFPYIKHEKENFRHLGYNWHSMDHTVSFFVGPIPTTEQQWKG